MPSDLWSQLPLIWYRQFFVTPPYPTTRWEDKTVIVTGANVGLGFEAARHFVRLGAAKVILAMRSIERGEKAKKSIEDGEKRPGIVQVWSLDLCSFDSVKAFARRATEELPRLDAVVENAGVIPTKFQLQEGHELTITTNVVATFLLMLLILPKLKETASRYNTQPHLSIISSDPSIFAELADEKKAQMGDRYNVSKLLEILACRAICAEVPQDYPVVFNLVNPGLYHSSLTREHGWYMDVVKLLLSARSTEVGSRTLVHAASAGPETHGQYLSECRVQPTASITNGPGGQELQKRVWRELGDDLERIQPGILKNL